MDSLRGALGSIAVFCVGCLLVMNYHPSGFLPSSRTPALLETAPVDNALAERDADQSVASQLTSPRLSRSNDVDVIEWPLNEMRRRERSLRETQARCSDIKRAGPRGTEARIRRLRPIGVDDLVSGQWNRFWVVAECETLRPESTSSSVPGEFGHGNTTSPWAPCCSGGDVIDVQLESPNAKVAVSRVFELFGDSGVYEVHVFLRKRHAQYRLGLDLLASGLPETERYNLSSPTSKAYTITDDVAESTTCYPPYPTGTYFISLNVSRGFDVIPVDRACTDGGKFSDLDLRDRFRFGAWFRLPSGSLACDGVHCNGNTKWFNTEGWVWASDLCRIQLVSPHTAQRRLRESSIFAWGASTLDQPLDILANEHLGSTTLGLRSKPMLQWAWSGCANSSIFLRKECQRLGYGIGFATWPRAARLLRKRKYDFILIERTAWNTYALDPPPFFAELAAWLAHYRAELRARYGHGKQPLQIFHGPPATENSKRVHPCSSLPLFRRHLNWMIEDYMTLNATEILYIGRHEMTLPLHFGTTFVHGTSHYGSTAKSCGARFERRKHYSTVRELYKMENCVRKVYGDAAVVAAWLNAWLTRG